jgi:hypothetical protein
MNRYFLSIVASAVLLVCLPLTGCGGGEAETITVKTGSLTKAEFAQRAGAVCASVRTRFTRDFARYYKDHFPRKFDSEAAWAAEVVDRVVIPDYEGQMIRRLSAIGVPASEEADLVVFLEELRDRVQEIDDNPGELVETPYPFAKIAKLAKKSGLAPCAPAFS